MSKMELLLTNSIGFIISYVAGCLPIPTKDYDERIEDCFHKALDKWNVSQECRDNARGDMKKYLVGLKEIITHTSKGRHPKECELLRLWAEEILGDPTCNQFILANQHEIMQEEIRKGLIKVEDVLETLNQQNVELQKVLDKVQQLANRGVTDAHTYWDRWSTGADGLTLDYDIVLAGRESVSEEVVKACFTPSYICIESHSQSDAMAFAVASILKLCPNSANRTLVIDNADVYREFTKEGSPLIIITNVLENHHYSVKNGHTVILCGTPAEKISSAGKFVLPIVDRERFQASLKSLGFDDKKISDLMRETKRESALLRRVLGINCVKEEWMVPNNNIFYIPAALLCSWDETRDGDKDIVEQLAGMDYVTFDKGMQMLINSNEPPFVKVGSIWQVNSPKQLLTRILGEISNDTIDRFKECINWILEDDDPDVLAKRDANDFRFWKDKHLYSGNLRGGLLQSITILAVVMESQDLSTDWIDSFVADKLKSFSIERFLSNRQNLHWLAESSPNAFISYLEDDVKNGSNVLKQVFEVKHSEYSITGSEIFYCELLFCLEQLAWDIRFLPRVTALLMDFSKYPNDSNYSNKPSASLYNAYRLRLPQTLVEFSVRLDILSTLAKRYPVEVSDLCISLLDGIKQTVFMPSSHFRWRYNDKIKSPKYINAIPASDVISLTNLLLSTIQIDENNLCRLIDLATNDFMSCSHDQFLAKLNECEEMMKGNEKIVECLRKNIDRHLRCRKATWALRGERLAKFQELLSRIESDDIVVRNKHYFADYLVQYYDTEEGGMDFAKQVKESRKFRKGILELVIDSKGWDGVWDLSHTVANVEALAEAIVELTDDGKHNEIYRLYCADSLKLNFVRAYFRTLFYDLGKEVYLGYINELRSVSDEKLGVVLYAPSVDSNITAIIDSLDGSLQKEYWENVNLWGLSPDAVTYAIERLRSVGRYSEILHFVYNKPLCAQINSSLWLDILFEMFKSSQVKVLYSESYYVAEILKCVDIPEDASYRSNLFFFELALFNHLRHHLRESELHLLQFVNSEPDMLMEIIKLVYLEDEKFRTEIEYTEKECQNRQALAQIAWNFLYHYHSVPGMKIDGTIDGDFLKDYLTRLQRLAEECHRASVIPSVIGRILGNIPETNDYPNDLLCELVEYYNNDNIDDEIGCCLSNRRGMTSRSPFAGGDIEREHVETFKTYRDRVLTKSSRLVKVFEREIKTFEKMAVNEDERGRLTDLQY